MKLVGPFKRFKVGKYGLVSIVLHLLLAALIAYEVFFLLGIYRVWRQRASLPTGIKTSRIRFDTFSKAQERYQKGQQTEVPGLEIGDPFNNFDPEQASE
jgi:hypothetical protein